jgi:hypothetical protein
MDRESLQSRLIRAVLDRLFLRRQHEREQLGRRSWRIAAPTTRPRAARSSQETVYVDTDC